MRVSLSSGADHGGQGVSPVPPAAIHRHPPPPRRSSPAHTAPGAAVPPPGLGAWEGRDRRGGDVAATARPFRRRQRRPRALAGWGGRAAPSAGAAGNVGSRRRVPPGWAGGQGLSGSWSRE